MARFATMGTLLAGWLLFCPGAYAANMSIENVVLQAGETGRVVVEGKITGESTFGWTLMLEIHARQGNRGTVTFTPALEGTVLQRPVVHVDEGWDGRTRVRLEQQQRPDVDIAAMQDVWPDGGTFTPFDTQLTGSVTRNGAVDENGTFIPEAISFSGGLASFPIIASPTARGVWDVMLHTSAGTSDWEGIETIRIGGSIAVGVSECANRQECDDRERCTEDTCEHGICKHVPVNDACRDWLSRRRGNLTGETAGGTRRGSLRQSPKRRAASPRR